MAGAQFNARPQLTAAVNRLANITEGCQGQLLCRTLRVEKEAEGQTNTPIHAICADLHLPFHLGILTNYTNTMLTVRRLLYYYLYI